VLSREGYLEAHKATALISLVVLAVLVGGCATEESPPETGQREEFREGTLSSNKTTETTASLQEGAGSSGQGILLRVEGGQGIRFSGLCTVGDREYVISGAPSKTYTFEDRPFSCRIQKQDSTGGNLKVTVVSGDSTRSVQQTNAEGGTVDVSHG
jgi:hypothetical protein